MFASSPNELRLRYKPMPSPQRQFLHVLADDYGLESRSEDSEPHRYVVVFKGPRFVSAPTKTISQCVKIRATQAADAAAAAAASRGPSPPPGPAIEPFNALLLTSPRFGLTVEDVNSSLGSHLAKQPSIHFNVEFLPTEEVLIRATVSYSSFLSPAAVGNALTSLKPGILESVRRSEMAGNVFLCHVDSDNHVTRREDSGRQDASGWSAVAGRAAARKESPMPEEPTARGSGRRLLGLKKKKPNESRERPWAKLDGDVEC